MKRCGGLIIAGSGEAWRRCGARLVCPWAALLAVLWGLAGGCGSQQTPVREGGPLSPFLESRHGGLEVRWWVVDDSWGVLGPTLADRDGRPGLFPAPAREVWSESGLRVLAVPLDALDGLQSSLPMVGPPRAIWHGSLPEWTEVVAGPRMPPGSTVRHSGGSFRVPYGQFRLLARSWVTPASGPTGSPGVRLELTPQLAAPAAPEDPSALAFWTRRLEREEGGLGDRLEGIAFTSLRASFTAERAMAYLVVPEHPGVDWSELPPAAPPPSPWAQQAALRALRSPVGPSDAPAKAADEPASDAESIPGVAMEDGADVFGPRAGEWPTLGEAMLRSLGPTGRPGEGRLKVVVVLILHPPERFDLLR